MNHSIHSADRSTHLKIVVIALVAGIAVAGFGISARTNSDYTQTAHVIKAGKPVAVTNSGYIASSASKPADELMAVPPRQRPRPISVGETAASGHQEASKYLVRFSLHSGQRKNRILFPPFAILHE